MTQPASAPPYPQGLTFTPKTKKPGGAVGIWIGVILILIGIVGGIALIVSGASSLADGLTDVERVSIDTGGTVLLKETGTYSVYAERTVFGGGTSFNSTTASGFVPDVQVSIIDPDGNPAVVRPAIGAETYTVDGHEGTRIGKFDVDQPGIYTIRIDGGQSVANYDTIGVGKGLHLDGIALILGGVFGGGALVLVGIIVIIVFAVKRSRGKKRIAQASNPYGAGPGGPAGGWPQAPAYGGAGAYPPAGGYGAPAAPWQPPGQAPAQAPGWVPPPVSPGTVGSPTPAAPPAQPWEPPASTPPSAAPEGTPTWQSPPPPAPPGPSWTPPPPPTAPDEPAS